MTRGEYLKLMIKPTLLFAIVPAGYGVLMMQSGGDAFGMPVGIIIGWGILSFTVAIMGAVLGIAALALWQPTFFRTLLMGFGLPVVSGALLWLAGAMPFNDFRDYTLLLCLLLSPTLLGAGTLHGVDARRLLRWEGILLGALVLPLLLWLPRWAMPVSWEVPRALLAAPILAISLLGVWIYARLPGEQPSTRLLRWEGGIALVLLAVFSVGVLALSGRVIASRKALALATFQERYPHVQVGEPQITSSQRETIVELPAEGWTYRVTLVDAKVVDDGYAQQGAAQAAADYLKRSGRSFLPIEPKSVRGFTGTGFREDRVPFPGAFEVNVWVFDEYHQGFRLLVYQGRVILDEQRATNVYGDRYVLPGPLTGAEVASHIKVPTGRPDLQEYHIHFAWEHGDGLWEYGFSPGIRGYGHREMSVPEGMSFGVALVRDGQLIALHDGLPRELWAPPH